MFLGCFYVGSKWFWDVSGMFLGWFLVVLNGSGVLHDSAWFWYGSGMVQGWFWDGSETPGPVHSVKV